MDSEGVTQLIKKDSQEKIFNNTPRLVAIQGERGMGQKGPVLQTF